MDLSTIFKFFSSLKFNYMFIPLVWILPVIPFSTRGCGGRDHMVVGFTTIYAISTYNHYCTNVVSSYPFHGEVYWIKHYVIKFVSDLRQGGGFLLVLWFLPPIK